MATQSKFNNRGYAELPPAMGGAVDLTPGGTSLANSPPVPVGAGGNPAGAIDRMLRHTMRNGQIFGNPALAMQAGGAIRQQQNFDAGQDFQKFMFDRQQAAMDARMAAGQGHDVRMFGLGQAALQARDAQRRQEMMAAMPEGAGMTLDGPPGGMPLPMMGGGGGQGGPPVPFGQGMLGGTGVAGINLPWVPGAAAPYLPKPGEAVPSMSSFGVERVGDWDILSQRTPDGVKFLNARGRQDGPPPGIEMVQMPGTAGMYAPVLGGKRLPDAPLFQMQAGLAPLPPGLAGPPEPTQTLQPWGAAQGMPWQITDMPGPEVKDSLTGKMQPGPKRKVAVDRRTLETRAITMPGEGEAGAGGGAKPSWMDWLTGQKK